jgi:hypothetical protein
MYHSYREIGTLKIIMIVDFNDSINQSNILAEDRSIIS